MTFKTIVYGLVISCIVAGCSSVNKTATKKEQEKLLLDRWNRKIASGTMGKANYIDSTLTNIDFWPFSVNTNLALNLKGDPYKYGTCAFFAHDHDGTIIRTRFVINTEGDINHFRFLDNIGPCKKEVIRSLEELRFTPGIKDNKRLPVLVIYPVHLDLIKKNNSKPK